MRPTNQALQRIWSLQERSFAIPTLGRYSTRWASGDQGEDEEWSGGAEFADVVSAKQGRRRVAKSRGSGERLPQATCMSTSRGSRLESAQPCAGMVHPDTAWIPLITV